MYDTNIKTEVVIYYFYFLFIEKSIKSIFNEEKKDTSEII